MIKIRPATISELEEWWNNRIANEPDAKQHKYFKNEYITKNKTGDYITFYALENDKYIGQATLIFKDKSAEMVRLELVPECRGKGISTKIFKHLENYAKQKGTQALLIGVEPSEIRNMQIYFHWGFTDFICITANKIEGVETNDYLVYSKKL